MATPPRNPDSPGRPAPEDDLFASSSPAPTPAPPDSSPQQDPDDQWSLEELPESPVARTRPSTMPAQPILPPSADSFETNKRIPMAAPAPSGSPVPAAVPAPGLASPLKSSPPAVARVLPTEADELGGLPAPAAAPAVSRSPRSTGAAFNQWDRKTATAPIPAPREEALPPAPSPAIPEPAEEEDVPEAPESESPRQQPVRSRAKDRVGAFVCGIILIALLTAFGVILYSNRPASDDGPARPFPRLPMAGQLVTITDVESGWRNRQAGDLVSTVDVALPSPGRLQPALLPQVQFTVDAAAGKTAFLRFIFLDPDRKIAGDVRVLRVDGGTIDPLASGAMVTEPGTATVYGSLGFMDRPGLVGYITGDFARWSVEISESNNASAKEEEWNRLDTFHIRNAVQE